MQDETQPVRPIHSDSGIRWLWWSIPVVTLAIIVVLLGLVLANRPADRQIAITLNVDGLSYQTRSAAATVRELLEAEQIPVGRDTTVSPSPDTPLTPGMTIVIDDMRSVILTVDGMSTIFRTVMENPLTILNSAAIDLGPDDEVRVNGTRVEVDRLRDWPVPANRITVRRALDVTIQVDDRDISLQTTAQTVGDALFEAGVQIYGGDEVTPALEDELHDNLTITLTRSQPITIRVDDTTLETRSQGRTVGEALREAGVLLNGLDYSVPPENANLRPGMSVRVVRVTEDVIAEPIPVPYQSVYQADPELEIDQRQIVQGGVNGTDQRNIRVRYENGVEVSRRDEGITRVTDPVDEIVRYGTQVVSRSIDTPEGPRGYWRKMRMIATSYHPAALGGDDVTATGARLTKGIVAADPGILPYGTQIYVPGYGVGTIADTGGPRRTRFWIDLGYDDDNYQSWARWVDVYVLEPVPENVPYLLPAR